MFIILFFISFFTFHTTHMHDTTTAPRKTISVQQLAANNHGKIYCDDRASLAKNVSQKFVLELNNARVYEDGHIITQDHLLLEDTVIKYSEKPLSDYHMLHRNELPKARHIAGRLAIVASPGSQCYYHWMFQILPRLKILKDLNIEYDALYIRPNA